MNTVQVFGETAYDDAKRMLVQEIRSANETVTIGSLILVRGDDAWIAPIPGTRPGEKQTRSRYYWKRAYCVSYESLLAKTQSKSMPRLVLVPEQLPDLWLVDRVYFSEAKALPLDSSFTHKQLKEWDAARERAYSLIEPIVTGRSIEDLLYDGELHQQVLAQVQASGKGAEALWTLVNRYVYAGAHVRGLFPRTPQCGGAGRPKFFAKPSGRKNRAFANNRSEVRGFICGEADRLKCERGWELFKTPDITVAAAYANFLSKYYAARHQYITPTQVKVTLLPEGQYPTVAQFTRFGQKGDQMRAAGLMNVSARARRNNIDGHGGTARSQVKLALQVGIIDSTCDDNGALCSMASPLLMLQSTWTTRIACVRTGYIFGEYTSFERVSARTHLAAIVHAGTPKVEWAKSMGYALEEGAWHHATFKSILSDGGEGKSLEVTNALEDAEIEAIFTQSYLSRARSLIENAHLMAHLLVDWGSAGSTFGKLRTRGEKLNTDSPYSYTEHLHRKIQAVCHYNNVMPVEHLLTIEMRRQGVQPTRRGIFEYMQATGQIADAPLDIEKLIPATLPRAYGRITPAGILIWDPRQEVGRRFVPNLKYWSPWLADSGLLNKARFKPSDILVAIDPVHLGRIYVDYEKHWLPVSLQTDDAEKHRLTFVDWLAISDEDDMKLFLAAREVRASRASLAASTKTIEKEGAARKKKALENGDVAPKGQTKRDRTAEEVERLNLQQLGINSSRVNQVAVAAQGQTPSATENGAAARTEKLPPKGSVLPTWMTAGINSWESS